MILVERFARRYVEEDRSHSAPLSPVDLFALHPLTVELGRLNLYRWLFAARHVLPSPPRGKLRFRRRSDNENRGSGDRP